MIDSALNATLSTIPGGMVLSNGGLAGYVILCGLMFVEGPIATLLASFLSSIGIFNVFYVFILSFLGNMIPDTLLFLFGRYSRKKRVESLAGKFGLSKKALLKLESGLKMHSIKTLFLLKSTKFISVFGIIVVGFLKLSSKRFFISAAIFNLLFSIVFVSIGFFSGVAFGKVLAYSNYIGIFLFCAVVFVIILGVALKIIFRKIVGKLTE
jgi:membrane protein DedA with SNARE-associated domain